MKPCPFCDLRADELTWTSDLVVAVRDKHPVSRGHTLVVARRHVPTFFDASLDEQAALLAATISVKRALDAEFDPAGYNVGFNAGVAAGQTVMHLHVHVIPRYRGDMDDPRGGVRHAIPSKGNYLRAIPPLATGGNADPFARHVLPLFDAARTIGIVAAFVQSSGVDRISGAILRARTRGANVQIVTGDYLEITQASALEKLLDWQQSSGLADEDGTPTGSFEARVVETEALQGRSFHPKAWYFESEHFGVAFVGSSNLSWSALNTGVEWNLRVDRDRDGEAYTRILSAFGELWKSARRLDAEWVRAYAARARVAPRALPPGEAESEPLPPAPQPHAAQLAALAKLKEARVDGRRRALVVLATGLGKTWLAAFDYGQMREELGTRPRLLFVAHRRELLRQAADTYRRLLREIDPFARIGWFDGDKRELSADLVFASVATLSRREHVAGLQSHRFDYVVIDEVHHATAATYRRILGAMGPCFLLGLTATPDRADAADVLGLFDDHLAYRADIAQGIGLGRLAPFHYFGVKDDIDYEQIPWRNQRFDPDVLATAAQTEARMETLWRVWNAHPGKQSLVFCCSVAHANYVRARLRDRGVRVAAVYAAEGSDDRDGSLEALARGDLDALCAVDVFNEGVDVPSVDRVVMLRPTESNVVFMQQLGRGLRAHEGKSSVTVVDFVGNHRVFLDRVRALLSLSDAPTPPTVRGFLDVAGATELPAGCSVELELEAKQLLARLFRVTGADEVERAYRELKIERGRRPSAGELHRMGYLPGRLRERHGSWFGFVRAENDLTADEARVAESAGALLREVETTEMTKCFKMVTLAALIESAAFTTGLTVRELAVRAHAYLRRSPELYADVAEEEKIDALEGASEKKWIAYWRRNPIEAWTAKKTERRAWFRVEGERFVLDLAIASADEPLLVELVRELVDYRLAQYRARKRQVTTSSEGFVCKVLRNARDPILKLPNRDGASIPDGETDVRLADGSVWQFRFAKEFCNVARPAGVPQNKLPDLLRSWFGPRAGQSGTAYEVQFYASPDGLWLEPVHATAIEVVARRGVVAHPDLRAAAGHAWEAAEVIEHERVLLPIDSDDRDLFAVRVAGTSMDGGDAPMRDGDWAVMRVARAAPAAAMQNRVVLAQVPGESFGSQFQIKRLERRGERWLLTSDNPNGPTVEPREDMVPVARLERTVRPEELAPTVGTIANDDELGASFGLDDLAPRSGRYGGHLFVFIGNELPKARPFELACAA